MRFPFLSPKGKHVFKKERNAIYESLTVDKRALTKLLVSSLVEGALAALVALMQKRLLEAPSIGTITLVTSTMALQVIVLVMFFEQQKTLAAHMSHFLAMKIAQKMGHASQEQLTFLQRRYGVVHSSLLYKIVQGFGSNLPILVKDVIIVLFQQIGIAIAFGWRYVLISLLGIGFMIGLMKFVTDKLKLISIKAKRLDAKTNNHISSMGEQLSVFQETKTIFRKLYNLRMVSYKNVALYQRTEWMRIALYSLQRAIVHFVSMWLILVFAVSEQRTSSEVVMLFWFVYTSNMVSYAGIQLYLYLTESRGDIEHLGKILQVPKRPEGDQEIRDVEAISLLGVRIHLPDGRVLFPRGLVPNGHDSVLHINSGEFVLFVGPSGCGKTRIAEILGRHSENHLEMSVPDSDMKITWEGAYQILTGGIHRNVFATTLDSFHRGIIYATQKTTWLDGMREEKEKDWIPGTVFDNLGSRLESAKLTSRKKRQLIYEVAQQLGLGEQLNQSVESLSGGEAIRSMIGRCLMGVRLATLDGRRCVLILDESLSQLDQRTALHVLAVIRQTMAENGGSVVMISHNHMLNPMDAKAYVFGPQGMGIVESGRVADLLAQKDSEYNRVLQS